MASASPLSQTSALLSIPTEIRLRIYHYLFKNEPNDKCFSSRPRHEPSPKSPSPQRSHVKGSTHGQDLTSVGRHPEILRVNHQIYFEAFPVFYSGLETVDPSKGTWRHEPKSAIQAYHFGDLNRYPFHDIVYEPPLMHNTTKPSKLAKFTKILFHVKFVIHDLSWGWRYDEETGELQLALQQRLIDKLRATRIVDEFVDKVAGYPWVDRLDVDIGLMASWERGQGSQNFSFFVGDPGEAHWERREKIWRKGDILAADLFLASGVLDPLQRLSNIRSWCIELTVEDVNAFGQRNMHPHERMTLDLSNAIKQKRTELCNGHNSNVVPCGLVWKPCLEAKTETLI